MFQYGATCYQSASTVNQLTGSEQAGSVVVIGNKSYILALASVSDTSITYDFSPIQGGPHISQTTNISPPPCALLQVQDAVDIGWMIAGVWIGVYVIMFLANYLNSEIQGISNDA